MASLLELLGQTWPARMAQSAWSAAKLPGDVYAGRTDPMSEEGIGRAADLAGMVMGGTYATAPRGAMGAGPVRRAAELPMDEASRMARAAEQGYTRDAYRGEGKALTGDEYVVGHPHRYDPGSGGDAIYSTNTPRLANNYAMLKAAKEVEPAQNVVPLKLRMENPKIISGEEKKRIAGLDKFERDDWLRDVFKDHDGVVVQYGGGDKTKRSSTYEEYVARPENYRSRFAKFDPANVGKSGLMLGGGGLIIGRQSYGDKE